MKTWHVVAAACSTVMLSAVAQPAAAHHSFAAEFDSEQPVTLRGTITKMEWMNPHTWLHIDVENDDGSVTEWGFELGAPPRLRRIGISPKFWQEGDRLVLKTRPLKDGRPAGSLVGARTDAGRTFGNTNGLPAE